MNGDVMQCKLTQEGRESSAYHARRGKTVPDNNPGLTAKLGFLEW